jgi:hypothetical protein
MRRLACAPVVLVALLLCGTASAAPVTVNLRVEGSTSTIFEAPVTTDGKVITKGSDTLVCDGTTNPANAGPGATPISALDDAAIAHGFTWDNKFGADFVSRIAAEPETATQFWGIAANYRPLEVGGCQQQVAAGDEVLFAFDFFAPDFSEKPLLKLSGPGKVATGQAATFSVNEFKFLPAPFPEPREFQQGPAAGAVIESAQTGPGGTAAVTFGASGLKRLKAERTGSIRSNSVLVCVSTTGTDDCGVPAGHLGTPGGTVKDSTAPQARISGPRNGRRYRRGPRLLSGTASDDRSGVREVKLALRRHVRGKGCQWWSGRRERFVGRNCQKKFSFGIGNNTKWSYLLPRPLGPGHYVLDVKVFDGAGNRAEAFRRGQNRTVFDVLGRNREHEVRAAAAPARVETMVVGKKGVIADPLTLRARAAVVRASGRRCAVAASTPLAALVAALRREKVGYAVRDYGSCTRRSTGSSRQLFVTRIARERNSGQDGWVYKVDDRAPGRGAADSRLRSGDRMVWLYCEQDLETGGCQRSLRAVPAKKSGLAGESLTVRVFGYDDKRARRPVPAARVTLTSGRKEITSALSAADGSALLTLPGRGRYELEATAAGLVPAFPVTIRTR